LARLPIAVTVKLFMLDLLGADTVRGGPGGSESSERVPMREPWLTRVFVQKLRP
jgi:hypothetical protein